MTHTDTLTWHRTQIALRIKPHNKRRFITGWQYGPLAVHRTYGAPTWSITHVASGIGLPAEFPTCAHARETAEQLLTLEGLWDNDLETLVARIRSRDRIRVLTILRQPISDALRTKADAELTAPLGAESHNAPTHLGPDAAGLIAAGKASIESA